MWRSGLHGVSDSRKAMEPLESRLLSVSSTRFPGRELLICRQAHTVKGSIVYYYYFHHTISRVRNLPMRWYLRGRSCTSNVLVLCGVCPLVQPPRSLRTCTHTHGMNFFAQIWGISRLHDGECMQCQAVKTSPSFGSVSCGHKREAQACISYQLEWGDPQRG